MLSRKMNKQALSTQKPSIKREHAGLIRDNKEFSLFASTPADHIFYLQESIGNRAVRGLLHSGFIQARLRIGQPGDIYEQEADRVANAVMRMPAPQVREREEETLEREPMAKKISRKIQRQTLHGGRLIQNKPYSVQIQPILQRQSELEEEEKVQRKVEKNEEEELQITPTIRLKEEDEETEEQPLIQTKRRSSAEYETNTDLEGAIRSVGTGGQPLPESVRAFFEPRFGQDFSQVRVHTGPKAVESARTLNARAYTRGRDIVFGTGQYAPATSRGRRLLAHELTHVVQQRSTLNSITNSAEIVQRDDVTQMSITPEYARGLSDEDLREQIRTLTEQVQGLEPLRISTLEGEEEYQPEVEDEYEVAQCNLSVLQAEQRRRRVEQRRRRIRQADWGSFRTHRDIDAAVSLEDRVLYVMESLVEQYNYPVDGAAALVGNLWVESRGTMAPNILEGGRLARRGEPAPQRGGVGLVQWTAERREAVLGTERGVDILFDMDAQIAYMVRELRGRYAGVNNVLNNPANLNQATRRVFRDYETPQVVVDWRRAVRGGDPAEIRRTEQIMNGAERGRRQRARRARDLYLREHSER